MRLGLTMAAVALAVFTAGARADINFIAAPGNFTGDENVLFNVAGLTPTGTTVQGQTQQSGFVIDFTSPTSLTTPAAGQARVAGETTNYTDLLIGLNDPLASFSTLIVNINAAATGTVEITATEPNNDTAMFTGNLSAGGENWFRLEAINGQRMSNVHFVSTAPVQDFRQIRLGGAARTTDVVPEPGSMALLAMGALPLIGLRRRK